MTEPDARFTVELTGRECATVFAIMDMEAKRSALAAATFRRVLPTNDSRPGFRRLAHDMAKDAAVMITVREKVRNACPGLEEAETEA